jgi:DNA-binding transcriptional LysR family regulator
MGKTRDNRVTSTTAKRSMIAEERSPLGGRIEETTDFRNPSMIEGDMGRAVSGISHVTLQKLEIFCLVVRLGSVTRAAESLGIAQPAVTAHLRSLEERVGGVLLRRDGRFLVLTEAGERVESWASDVVDKSMALERDLKGLREGESGSAVIGSTMAAGSYSVTDIVAEFLKGNPRAKLTIQISNPKVVLSWVRNGACDFAVLILDPSQDISGLIVRKLWDEPVLLVASPDSQRVGEAVENSLLTTLDFVTPPRGLVTRDLEDSMLRANGLGERKVILELGHPEAIKRAVRGDAGVSFLLESTIRDEIHRNMLRQIATPGLKQMAIPLFLAYRRKQTVSRLQRRLLDFIENWRWKGIDHPSSLR